jgi:hypothetical protein
VKRQTANVKEYSVSGLCFVSRFTIFKTTNMKLKLICLLAVLFGFSLVASPNRCCDRTSCTGKIAKQATTPAKGVTMMIDDTELLPVHQYFSNF